MASHRVPVYRHGRKFYVSADEYERIQSEERRQRQISAQKSHNLSVPKAQQVAIRTASRLDIPIRRSQSNPSDYQYGVLRTPHLPTNSLINTTRPSRSILRNSDNSYMLTRSRPGNTRSSSLDRMIEIQRTPISFDYENDLKRSLSPSRSKLISLSTQKSSAVSRRPMPTTILDYGVGPTTTVSLTPNEQSHGQTNSSTLTNYFARVQQSSLNPPAKSFPSAVSGTGSFLESGVQGSTHGYTVLGSSNRRTAKNDFYRQDPVSDHSSTDDNSAPLLTLFTRRNTDAARSRRSEYITEFDDDPNQQRDLWTRSTIRSQSSDGLTEKKRVRFADMEGLTLESEPTRTQLKSPVVNRFLSRRQHTTVASDARGQMYIIPTTNLATDV